MLLALLGTAAPSLIDRAELQAATLLDPVVPELQPKPVGQTFDAAGGKLMRIGVEGKASASE